MQKVKHWYYVVDNKIVSYGDSSQYTEEEATKLIKKIYPTARVATKKDLDKLL